MLGALFHTLFASSMNLFLEIFEKPVLASVPFTTLLVSLTSSGVTLREMFSGFVEMQVAFHISVSLI